MQLDPKIAMWIKIILALLTAITTGTLSFTGLVSPSVATQIVAYAGVALTVLSIVMSAYSSSAPGPLAPPDPPAVVHAQAEVDAQAARTAADKAAAIAAAHAAPAALPWSAPPGRLANP